MNQKGRIVQNDRLSRRTKLKLKKKKKRKGNPKKKKVRGEFWTADRIFLYPKRKVMDVKRCNKNVTQL